MPGCLLVVPYPHTRTLIPVYVEAFMCHARRLRENESTNQRDETHFRRGSLQTRHARLDFHICIANYRSGRHASVPRSHARGVRKTGLRARQQDSHDRVRGPAASVVIRISAFQTNTSSTRPACAVRARRGGAHAPPTMPNHHYHSTEQLLHHQPSQLAVHYAEHARYRYPSHLTRPLPAAHHSRHAPRASVRWALCMGSARGCHRNQLHCLEAAVV